MPKTSIQVQGLNDERTVRQVGSTLLEVWGILSVDDISAARSEVTFTYDDKAASLHDFCQALRDNGFETSGGCDYGEHV